MLCHPFVARSRARRLLALPVLLFASAPAALANAQAAALDHRSAPHADVLELTFEEAIDLALVRPEARVAEQVRTRRADADADVGRWVGNPQVQVQVGRRRRPQADVGVEAQITLLQGFALGRVGAARLDVLAAEFGALDVEERAERMLAALEAGEAWLVLQLAEQRLVAAVARVEVGQQHHEVVTRARTLSAATEDDSAEAARLLGELHMARLAAEAEVRAASLELAHATAQHGPFRLATAGPAPEVTLPDLASLRADEGYLDGLPTLRLRTALLRVAEARQREAERDARGTGALGVYVERDSPRGIVVAGVAQFTLGVVDRGGPARAAAAEAVARAEAEIVRASHESHAVFHAAIDALEVTRATRDRHGAEVLVAYRARVSAIERRFALGAATRAELLRASLDLALAEMDHEELAGDAARAQLRLRLLLDATVSAEVQP
jgi:hypothetical protein